ncbi:MAG: hypothetical protein KGL26_01655 [Pseudomonadota bacterium]|nr:hypothetical protein [Pseudomonadota bacterium]
MSLRQVIGRHIPYLQIWPLFLPAARHAHLRNGALSERGSTKKLRRNEHVTHPNSGYQALAAALQPKSEDYRGSIAVEPRFLPCGVAHDDLRRPGSI